MNAGRKYYGFQAAATGKGIMTMEGGKPEGEKEFVDAMCGEAQAQGVNFSWELKKRRRARETQEALEADPLTEATRLELSQYIDIENDITESAAQQMLSIIAAMKGKPRGGRQ